MTVRTLALALASLSIACVPPDDVCGEHAVEYPSTDRDDADPFGPPRCDVLPDLCGLPVDSTITEADLERAIDLVFVGDGYRSDELPGFAARVSSLVDQLRGDAEGIVGRAPELFNVHVVSLPSRGSALAERALGSCVVADDVDHTWMLRSDLDRVARAAANAPDADVVFVLSRGTHGRANAAEALDGLPIIRLHEDDDAETATHELGHALLGLADEYVDVDETYPALLRYASWTSDLLPQPNASTDPDEPWGGLEGGRIEGAVRYARGVFRPTNSCRMLDSRARVPFCEVCSAHVDRWLEARRGVDDGPPTCGFAIESAPTGPGIHFWARDANGIAGVRVFVGEWLRVPFLCPGCRTPILIEQDLSIDVPAGAEITLECTDSLGATARATLLAAE